MKFYSMIVLAIIIGVFFSSHRVFAFDYFGGQVTDWQEQNSCPITSATNSFLDGVCGATGGVICLELDYGTLTFNGGLAIPNALNAKFNKSTQIGVLSVKDKEIPIPLAFYQKFLNYGFTQTNSWVLGQALDFTPSCDPCSNDIEREVLSKAGVDMNKYCGNFLIKATLSLATSACNAALSAAASSVTNLCPTKLDCFVGSSHFGLPGVGINLCEPSFSVGGFKL